MMKQRPKLLLLLALFLAFGGVAAIFRQQLLEPLARLIIVHEVSRDLGLEITVAKISGSYFRDLRLIGIKTIKPARNGMLVALGADSLEARYSLARLAGGLDDFLGGLRLEIEGARVELDLSRNWYGTNGESTSPAPVLVLPLTRATNSTLELRDRAWSLSLTGIDLTVGARDEGGGIPLAVHASGSVIDLPYLHRQSPELGARGVLSRDWVRIDGLQVNGRQAIESARFDYATGQPVRGTATFTAFGGGGEVEALFAETSTVLSWNLRQIELGGVDALLDLPEPLPTGRLTSRGRLAGKFSEPASLQGSFSLAAKDGSIRSQPYRRLALTGQIAAGSFHLDSLAAEMGANIVTVSGVAVPLRTILAGEMAETVRNLRGSFHARLGNVPALLAMFRITVPRRYFPEKSPPHRLVLAGRVSEGGVTLKSGTFSAGGGQVALERFVVRWPRSGPLLEGLRLAASFKAELPDLGRSAALFGLADVGGCLHLAGALEGTLKDLRGNLELRGRDLRFRQLAVDRLFLVARSEPVGWRLVNLEIDRGKDRLAGRGTISLSPLLFKGMSVDLIVGDIGGYLDWLPAGAGKILPRRGGLEVHLVLSGSPAEPEGSFDAALRAAEFAGITVSRAEMAGSMRGDTLKVTRLVVRTPQGRMETAGIFRHRGWGLPLEGTVDRLVVTGREPLLRLQAPVAFRVAGENRWSLTEATLAGAGGFFSLKGEMTPHSGCNFSFRLKGVRSEPWRPFFPDLSLEFRGLELAGAISGSVAAPVAMLAGRVAELRAAGATKSLTGEVDLSLSSSGVVLKTFSWSTKAGARISLNGTIPYNLTERRFLKEPLALKGIFAVPDLEVFSSFLPAEIRLAGSLNGTLTISGKSKNPEAAVDLHARNLRLPALLKVHPRTPISVDAVMALRDGDLRLVALTAHGEDLNLTASGTWHEAGALLAREPGAGLPGSLDFRAALSMSDLGWLSRAIPMVRRLGGRLDGTLALSGPASEPEISADLSLADGEFRAENTIPPLRNLQAHLTVRRREATIERFSGTVGGSPFAVSGSIALPVKGDPVADLRVRGTNILLYRSDKLGVRGDADISVRGSLITPAFAGTVAITDGRLRQNLDWLEMLRDLGHGRVSLAGTGNMGASVFSFRNSPLKDATFDIHLTSRKPFLVKSNVARGGLRPDLRLQGTGEVPLLTGVVYIDSSRILLPGGRLAIDSGLLRFTENNPGRPQLEITGSSRILGYDINVTVEGNYDEPTISLSSVPPLPQDQLLLLLLTGKLPPGSAEQQVGWQGGGMKVALYVGQGVLAEWFGSSDLDREESLLDRFDVVVGRGISRQGNETVGTQYRLADGVIRNGDQLYLVAERDIYDELNVGLRVVFRFK